jgi:two-component system cell cycle response regulator
VTRAFRSLASTLIRRTIVGAALVTLLAASVQAWLTVREERQVFDRTLRQIAETNVPLLSVSLWDIEPAAVRRQLETIASRAEISHVRLTAGTGHVFLAGVAPTIHTDPDVLQVPYPDGRAGTIGRLEITANRSTLYAHVAEHVLGVVAGYALLSMVICALIAMVLRRELERPMRDLTEFTRMLSPTTLTRPLTLSRPERPWDDEIDQLALGFRTLQDGIHSHVANLDSLVRERTRQLEGALDEIRALTLTDPLTGCYNRRYLDERLVEQFVRSQRSGRELSLAIVDIDHFKRVNDTYGHAAGDEVLRGLADILIREMRAQVDWVARIGGEEFVVLLPETGLEAARVVAERLRIAVAAAHFNVDEVTTLRITASFGVATRLEGDTAESLLARADAMLYRAKKSTRNLVVASAQDALTVF